MIKKSNHMQHCASKTKDNNTLDDVLDGILDAFNPRPWRTRSTLEDAFNPGGRARPLLGLTGMVLHIDNLFSHLLSP